MQFAGTLVLPDPWPDLATWTEVRPGFWVCGDWGCAVHRGYAPLWRRDVQVLSFRRRDGARDADRFLAMWHGKNAILGPEAWAYECYPPCGCLYDTDNVYHLIEVPVACGFDQYEGSMALYPLAEGDTHGRGGASWGLVQSRPA